MIVYPKAGYATARVNSCKLMARTEIRREILSRLDRAVKARLTIVEKQFKERKSHRKMTRQLAVKQTVEMDTRIT